MRKITAFAFVIVLIVGITLGYGASLLPSPSPKKTLDEIYQSAVRDAMVAEDGKVCYNLTAITDANPDLIWAGEGENRTVLVVTWTKYYSSYPVGGEVNLTWGETWVTIVPEIKTFFTHNLAENRTLRAEQLLGLPPNSDKTHFVELWVKPQDLFRPSPDSEINDTSAQLSFPPNTDPAYIRWFDDNIIYSYFTKQYLWTRLGYTYDWGNPNGSFGLSEYVIQRNSVVKVEAVTPTADYLP